MWGLLRFALPRQDRAIGQRVSEFFDRVLVRSETAYAVQNELRQLTAINANADWTECLSDARGLVGLVNSSMPGSPAQAPFAAIGDLNRELREQRPTA